METAVIENIVKKLFATHAQRQTDNAAYTDREIPLFTVEELVTAVKSLQNRKAPGPDGIPSEALKAVTRTSPLVLLNICNACLERGNFPLSWKTQRLVLISKGKGDPKYSGAYRPLYMLNTAGKLLEKVLKPRLVAAIQKAEDLSTRQYGNHHSR